MFEWWFGGALPAISTFYGLVSEPAGMGGGGCISIDVAQSASLRDLPGLSRSCNLLPPDMALLNVPERPRFK